MPTIEIETDQLLRAALQMPRKEFERFVTRLFTLKARQQGPGLSEREADLLMKIKEAGYVAIVPRLAIRCRREIG